MIPTHRRRRALEQGGELTQALYSPPVAVRVCRQHDLDCYEDGDRILCPAGHRLKEPVWETSRIGGQRHPEMDTAALPWRVEIRRSARLEG